MPATVRVQGLRELNRAFARVSADVKRDNVKQLREASEPARAKAEDLAASNITNITPTWSRMKLGVTARAVYVAPRARRHGGSPRKNLGQLLLKQAMLPAAEQEQARIRAGMERWLDRVIDSAGL